MLQYVLVVGSCQSFKPQKVGRLQTLSLEGSWQMSVAAAPLSLRASQSRHARHKLLSTLADNRGDEVNYIAAPILSQSKCQQLGIMTRRSPS